MQCYEFELMLDYIDWVVQSADPIYKYERTDLISQEILEQTRASSLQELMQLEQATIRQIARPYVDILNNVA